MNTIRVNTSGSYEVNIGSGLLSKIAGAAARLVRGRRAVVVSDRNVWALYGENLAEQLRQVGFRTGHYVFAPGEASKNPESFLEAIRIFGEAGLRRDGCVIALGGGVTGDLAGFAAACYMRGIAYIQVPTSLLAMVDSSVGGKTAINTDIGKNICGAFHQPIAVFCDTDSLDTLPEENFREGCAEIIKYAVLFDPALFAHLEQAGLAFDREYVISRCIELKAGLVEEDEFDKGSRRLLNLGHTVGHAIEKISHYRISHGQAVAIGMSVIARGAAGLGICSQDSCQRILSLIARFGLPVSTCISPEALLQCALSDKKAETDQVHTIVPRHIGCCDILPLDEGGLRQLIFAGCQYELTVFPGPLHGSVSAPASKSCAHRALICAALADEASHIHCGPVGQDVTATVRCLNALGAQISETDHGFHVDPIRTPPAAASLPCGESGATLRFLLPIAGALGVEASFHLEGRLAQRPLSPLWEEMERMGCQLRFSTENTLLCTGRLRQGIYKIDGSVSSQFISGLLMAMPLIGESSLQITGRAVSQPYVDLTLDIMNRKPHTVEGDWSSAAFWLAAKRMGSDIAISGLAPDSRQGDRAITQLLEKLQSHCCISAADIPDLIPVLSVVAAANKGAVFTDTARLRLKESDRVAAITEMLAALGGKAEAGEDTLTVFPATLTGGTVDSKNDHRIAMAAAVAAGICRGPVTILNAGCTEKSYPGFWHDFQQLGGRLWKAATEQR